MSLDIFNFLMLCTGSISFHSISFQQLPVLSQNSFPQFFLPFKYLQGITSCTFPNFRHYLINSYAGEHLTKQCTNPGVIVTVYTFQHVYFAVPWSQIFHSIIANHYFPFPYYFSSFSLDLFKTRVFFCIECEVQKICVHILRCSNTKLIFYIVFINSQWKHHFQYLKMSYLILGMYFISYICLLLLFYVFTEI